MEARNFHHGKNPGFDRVVKVDFGMVEIAACRPNIPGLWIAMQIAKRGPSDFGEGCQNAGSDIGKESKLA